MPSELRRPRPGTRLPALPVFGNPKGSQAEREAWMRRRQQLKASEPMATKIWKPVTRETSTFDHTSPIVVTLYPKYLEVRLKGEKSSHTIPYDLVRKMAMRNGGK